jgi:four helix bundle protein
VHDFRRLEVWHQSIELAGGIYRLTEALPVAERYGLTAQMRRAAVSVSSNIAEGAARGTDAEMARFLKFALGSLSEVDSQVELAVCLGYLGEQPDLQERINRLRSRIKTLHDHFESRTAR